MLKSMTGFGRCELVIDNFTLNVQIRSVNHRYMDCSVRIPRCYNFIEDKIRQTASEYISRGKIEISVSIKEQEGDDKVITLNQALAQNYINVLKELAALGIEDDIKVSTVARYSDIFSVEYKEIDEEKMFEIINTALIAAFDDFNRMRSEEGARLEANILSHLDFISGELEKIEARSPETVRQYRENLEAKIRELIEDTAVDENRLITETAIFADKVAIDEETVRLRSHMKAFKNAIKTDKPIGKKLDFIIQEMNRETNTIGSKANDIEIASMVVEIKSEIEKIREQIQNIE
ncbi:MAG: YicC family protein [Ruminococcaceae bacterium]|nr:YicC family protein [Oscillospiraceae bacterium]